MNDSEMKGISFIIFKEYLCMTRTNCLDIQIKAITVMTRASVQFLARFRYSSARSFQSCSGASRESLFL